jgi:N-acetylmuramate 1-kinase
MAHDDWQRFGSTLAQFYGPVRAARARRLKGDASTRAYYRIELDEPAPRDRPASAIVMQLPEPYEPGSAAETQARAFIDVRNCLDSRELPVPEIYAIDLAHGRLLLEDLGDLTFEARLARDGRGAFPELYGRALDLLARLHQRCEPPQPSAACVAFRKRFDAALLRSELDHFREWGLEALHGVLSPQARAALDARFDELTGAIVALPDGFVHRDYQSRNLMWPSDDRLVIIDFQDAFVGPAPYDLVALLCDSYVELEPGFQRELLARYAERRAFTAAQSEQLGRGFDLITVQRKLKDAGRFVFLDRVRNNPDFLRYYDPSLRHVARALARLPERRPLAELLHELVPGFPSA